MKSIEKFIFTTPAWKLFCIGIVLFVAFALLMFSDSISSDLKKLSLTISSFIGVSWLYLIGKNLYSMLENKSPVKFAIFVTTLCFIFFGTSYFLYYPKNSISFFMINFSFFYCTYFISKSLVSVEFGREADFYSYIGTFFLVWMLPYGIFWLQPRLKIIYGKIESLA
jgi:hypothetical protein